MCYNGTKLDPYGKKKKGSEGVAAQHQGPLGPTHGDHCARPEQIGVLEGEIPWSRDFGRIMMSGA
jgi:hypothetical protein